MRGIHRTPKHKYANDGNPDVPGITTSMKAKQKGRQLVNWELMQVGRAAIREQAKWVPHLAHEDIAPSCPACMAGWAPDRTPEDRAARWLTKWPGFVSAPKMKLGTAIHTIAESVARHEALDFSTISDVQMPFVESFIRDFIEGGKTPGHAKPKFNPRYIEYMVYRDGDEWCKPYGGTMDLACALGDDVVLLDHKTGSGVYDEVRFQLAAGANGTVACQLCPGCRDEEGRVPHQPSETYRLPKVTKYAVLHIRPEEAAYVPFDINPSDFQSFAAARQLWWFDNERKREAKAA